SPDSQIIYFSSGVPGFAGVWKIPAVGGFPTRITRNRAVFSAVSPDGKHIAYRTDPPDGSAEVIVTSSASDEILFRFPMREFTQVGWTPSSDGIVWARQENGVGNLWVQPIRGGAARKLTNFPSEDLYSFAWSRDGRMLAVARGWTGTDAVLVNDAR